MIDKTDPIPLYVQLQNSLIDEINQNMQPNQKMISEREISSKYEVSRTTVRLALYELENAGYIYKRQGKGTFVAALNRSKQNLSEFYSFTEQMISIGKQPRTEVLVFELIVSNQYISEKLGIILGEKVFRIQRLRLANEIPMMLEVSYLPCDVFPELSEKLVKSKPLYEIFSKDYQQQVKVVDEEFSVGSISQKEAALIKLDTGTPCLHLKRQTYNEENRVIEFTSSVARGDKFVYKLRHVR